MDAERIRELADVFYDSGLSSETWAEVLIALEELASVRAELEKTNQSYSLPLIDATNLRRQKDAELEKLREENAVLQSLVNERNRILDAVPCPNHGRCVPFVLEEFERLRGEGKP